MPQPSSLKLFKTFKQAHNFLLNLKPQDYSTERIEAFLECLDNPQERYKVIHVAGTSGKGSTCQMIASILKQAGYKTGLMISPYLVDPLEKIQINNRQISQKQFIELVNEYKKLILKYKLTYFEAFIALSFIYFSDKKIDYAVVETGLGGRHDATNVFKNPALSIITNIGLDHTDMLGNTKQKIAREKQQIIKNKNALTGSKLIKNAKFIDVLNYKIKYKINLLGDFQKQNAALAIEAAKFLNVSEKYIKAGLLKVKHFGRFTIISKKPLIIIDGAHNPEKMKAFVSSLIKLFDLNKYNKKNLLLAIKYDKDYKKIIKTLTPLFNDITVTKFAKSYDPKILYKQINKHAEGENCNSRLHVLIQPNPKKAYKKLSKNLKPDDLLIVTGSLYLIGDIFS